jgi:hypothetical protein
VPATLQLERPPKVSALLPGPLLCYPTLLSLQKTEFLKGDLSLTLELDIPSCFFLSAFLFPSKERGKGIMMEMGVSRAQQMSCSFSGFECSQCLMRVLRTYAELTLTNGSSFSLVTTSANGT